MEKKSFKFQMYKSLKANTQAILEEAAKPAAEIGIPAEYRGKIGITGASSGCPAPLRDDIREAADEIAGRSVPLAGLMDEIRCLVKSVYGDEYDAQATNTCEGGLWASFGSLFSPPISGIGDNYRTRYLVPYEKQLHYHGSFGRPFPPRYKDYLAERGGTAGELGSFGRRLNNLDTVLVPLVGAKYEVHGINYHPVPLLLDVDARKSAEAFRSFAKIHAPLLSGIVSLGYDTANYGYGEKTEDGAPLLQKLLGDLAKEYNIPYVVDNAWGVPFIGTDIRKTGADIFVYSMDKATGADTSGLVIGKEEVMVAVRRGMGTHGARHGTASSYSKAMYSGYDPGRHAIATQIQTLKVLRDQPERLTKPVDDLEKIVREEFAGIHPKIRAGIRIEKSYNSRTVEVNYEDTWKNAEFGLPLFSMEDVFSGTNLINGALVRMGIHPGGSNDGLICLSPDMGTTDSKGNLIPDAARFVVKGLVRTLEILEEYSGFLSE